ncbi:unnamed protein product [Acanthoscelides obtectus]|uniref:DNA-directed DNA polymerase n=1 Tax=Acanthoscelides obtectus TaxID=200917 RepID=A0A9P0LYU0_ACAOB|nr:unnamed protein product [Acanthoscelides obtectus]CAK1670198.1 PiggyBac transposable element-derived protein 1 [Acanthoscelides obtectus]
MSEESVKFKGSDKLPDMFCNLETPYQFFTYFYNQDLIKLIVEQSNLFSVQLDTGNPVSLQETDIKRYIGICVLVGQENTIGLNESDLGACANIVTRLLRNLPNDMNYHVYFDNYYTTLPLLAQLSQRGVQALGTIRRNRIPKCPLPGDKEMSKENRGTSKEYITETEGVPISSIAWKNNKIVSLVSTFCGTLPKSKADRCDKSQNKRVEIDCPKIVKEYNKHMGGVDLMDSLIGRYRIKLISRKWYFRLFYHLLDMTINTRLLGKRHDRIEKTSLYPNVIMRGTKLILMEVGNVKFLDSLNYFPMPLTALPKAFDLKELKKGYFPHLFNTLAHQNYVGPIPALDFYDPDHLKEDAREKLLKWHGERQAEGYVFDFQKEIVEYCISDVEILTQACLKFRDLMKTETTVDPFQESTTIASCCNKVFRRNFLKPETIGILPNQNLYHPVLPSKMNNKLMFVNCQKCGEDFVREECQHSIQERSIKGTWVIEEVLKAIEKGYQIIETYEIWEYDTIQLSKDQEGLFSGMMNKFLHIKQQASGWPKHCLTDEEKNRYIDAFLDREDIKLEFSKIIENPCLRSLAKLMLNSFWGKFAQKENQNKTSIVRDCGEFFDMLTNPSIHVNTVLPVNEETLLITWEFREEAYDVSSTVNVVLASYVTALARLKLYSFLEKVEERAVYVDTDSCIYISRKGLDDISTGDFIGDMTDELNGGFISEFVSGGPKNYAYKYTTLSGEEQIVCKVKGISLNYKASQVVNFEKIKDMVLKKSDPVSVLSRQLRRTREHAVVTVEFPKVYKITSMKRKFYEDHTSVPFGFKKITY